MSRGELYRLPGTAGEQLTYLGKCIYEEVWHRRTLHAYDESSFLALRVPNGAPKAPRASWPRGQTLRPGPRT